MANIQETQKPVIVRYTSGKLVGKWIQPELPPLGRQVYSILADRHWEVTGISEDGMYQGESATVIWVVEVSRRA